MKPSSEMERAHYGRIEKLRNLSYVVSLYIQYFITFTIIVAILISFWSLPYQFSSLTDVGSESLISFLKYIINIIIAMELIRVLCHQTLDTIVEILLMAVTRELIIEHMSPHEMFFGILAVGVLFAIRKFLYISQLDKTSRQKLRLARIVTGKPQRTPEPKEEASGTQEEKAD